MNPKRNGTLEKEKLCSYVNYFERRLRKLRKLRNLQVRYAPQVYKHFTYVGFLCVRIFLFENRDRISDTDKENKYNIGKRPTGLPAPPRTIMGHMIFLYFPG